MTHVHLSIRPHAATVKLAEDQFKLVELTFLSEGLTMKVDLPLTDFETIVAKWADLQRQRSLTNEQKVGLFRRAP